LTTQGEFPADGPAAGLSTGLSHVQNMSHLMEFGDPSCCAYGAKHASNQPHKWSMISQLQAPSLNQRSFFEISETIANNTGD